MEAGQQYRPLAVFSLGDMMLKSDLLLRIRDYTGAHAELGAAHHFTFDLPIVSGDAGAVCLLMGINPGETEEDRTVFPGPTEESSEYDFHTEILRRSGRMNRGRERWAAQATFFTDGRTARQSEFFFWSSPNSGQGFRERFGTSFGSSPHLRFCAEINLDLIKRVKPTVVLAPGVNLGRRFSRLYGLTHLASLHSDKGHRLVEHYEQSDGTPWLFTKHWTGAFGFSNEQRGQVRDYIRSLVDKI
jgi:hypothetical protein